MWPSALQPFCPRVIDTCCEDAPIWYTWSELVSFLSRFFFFCFCQVALVSPCVVTRFRCETQVSCLGGRFRHYSMNVFAYFVLFFLFFLTMSACVCFLCSTRRRLSTTSSASTDSSSTGTTRLQKYSRLMKEVRLFTRLRFLVTVLSGHVPQV